MKRYLLVLLGLLLSPLASAAVEGCSACDDSAIVRDMPDGMYGFDDNGPRNELGADTEYRITISNGGSTVVETFTRDGKKHQIEYSASAPVKSPLRTDHGPSSD